MQPKTPEFLDDRSRVESAELARMCGLSEAELDELVEYGALPVGAAERGMQVGFSASVVPPLRTAMKLRADFDLDLFTAGLLVAYLQRIAELEDQVRLLQAHLPRAMHHPRDGPASWREPHA